MAKKPVWDKPRPKGLGKSKKLTPAQRQKQKLELKLMVVSILISLTTCGQLAGRIIRRSIVPDVGNQCELILKLFL